MPSVLITGAGGFVASHVRRHLTRRGHRVVAASRRPLKPAENETVVRVSSYSDGAIPELAAGFDAVLHLAGSGRQTAESTYREANLTTTLDVVRACRAAGIRRIVYMSGLGVSAESPLDYFISKYGAERAIAQSGIDHTILRPSYIIGPDDCLTRTLRGQVRNGEVSVPGSGRYAMQPVSVYDAVAVLEMAAAGGLRNRTLDLVGPRTVSFLDYAAALAGPDVAIRHADIEGAYREAILRPDAPYGVDELNIMVAGFLGDHGGLRAATGMSFRDVLEARGRA